MESPKLSYSEMVKEVPNWENEYLTMKGIQVSQREEQILSGDDLKAHEGMMYGRLYADWKRRKGYE